FSCVSANGARLPAIAMLRSPHFQFAADDERHTRDVMALDPALAEGGDLGEVDALDKLVEGWAAGGAARAGRTLIQLLRELLPLSSPAPVASHLTTLIEFL